MKQFLTEVQCNRQLARDIHELVLAPHEAIDTAQPGQFAHVMVSDGLQPLLRRPMSICRYRADGTWSIIFRCKGSGTQVLAACRPGTRLDVLAPLGRGFRLPPPGSRPLLVGGGVGVPPLLFLATELCRSGFRPEVLFGFASAGQVIGPDIISALGLTCHVATDDGSRGHHGLVTDLLVDMPRNAIVYACGPLSMLRAVALRCSEEGVASQVSLEAQMACGTGACLSCVCPVRPAGSSEWVWQRVCREGPVFCGAEVAFDVML